MSRERRWQFFPSILFPSILLDIWDLPVDRKGPRIDQVSVDAREAPASEKLSG